MANKISVTALKKKYPHPVRAFSSKFGFYCVGGALCRETKVGEIDFPNEQQLKEAVGRVNRIIGDHWYELSTKQQDEIYALIHGVIEMNDAGRFDISWTLLGKLLRRKADATKEKR
jgi:hypothetical protein